MLKIDKKYVQEMVGHALEDNPNECCGILAGPSGKVIKLYRMENTEHSPYRYNMSPKELYQTYREIEDNNWDLVAIYHSHTHSPAYPSATDVRLATWPEAHYILVSLADAANPVVRAFRIEGEQIIEDDLVAE